MAWLSDLIEREDGLRFALVVAPADEPMKAQLRVTVPGPRLVDTGGRDVGDVSLKPYAVQLLEVR